MIRSSKATTAKRRAESKVIASVRDAVFRRDYQGCRACLAGVPRDYGAGFFPDQWAHIGAHRRSRTRKMDPEERHTTAGSLRLCAVHHEAEEQHQLKVEMVTADGADGPLIFHTKYHRYAEGG